MVIISNLYPDVIKVCRPLVVEDDTLRDLVKRFSESISKSLSVEHSNDSTVKCELTYVNDFPDGTEKGSFIGLDFSGKIFRLVHVVLKGDRNYTSMSRLYEFPENKNNENLTKIAEYVAKCVNNFIGTYDINSKKIILGAASIFPMIQNSLQEGELLNWQKEFLSKDSTQQDFFTSLKMALKKYKFSKGIYFISLTSNATACLLAGFYKDPAIRIGLFLEEQINLTYIERIKNMTTYTGDGLRSHTALSVKLDNFGSDGVLDFIKTEFDFMIDAASSNPGESTLEKFVSTTYLGEVARLCLYKLASMRIILNGYTTPGLNKRNGLKTSDLAMMEMDDEKNFIRCKAVMRNLGYKDVSDSDCVQIRFVSRCVARRSSNLMAAFLTAMVNRMDNKDIRIIGDGFLLKYFPNYERYLMKKIRQLKKPEIRFQLKKAEKDEIAVGAGILAQIYKDGVIKLEDKYRALPKFNSTKYEFKNLPASFLDCECEPLKMNRPVKKESEMSEMQKEVYSIRSEDRQDIREFAEPIYVSPFDLDD